MKKYKFCISAPLNYVVDSLLLTGILKAYGATMSYNKAVAESPVIGRIPDITIDALKRSVPNFGSVYKSLL